MKTERPKTSNKPRKPPLRRRLGDKLETISEASRETIRDPRGTPRRAHGWFRRWFRKLFEVRGGGLYALGYIATFVYLEVTTFASELVESTSASGFIGAQLFDFVFRFLSDSIANMIQAFLWPVRVIAIHPPYGIVALGLAFLAFDRLVKPPLKRWMFADEPDETEVIEEQSR